MNPEEENIGLDDISFDDVISGGSESSEVTDDLAIDSPEAADEELEADAEEVKESEEEEEEILDEEEEEDDEDEEDDERDPVESTVVAEILDKLGYETEEEYDDTPEGLLAMTQDVGKQMAEDQFEQAAETYRKLQGLESYGMTLAATGLADLAICEGRLSEAVKILEKES